MIMNKEYRSFEEIDQRLKILSLQRQIHQEGLKLHINQAKSDLIPRKLFRGLDKTLGQNSTWKSILLAFATKKILAILRSKRQQKKLSA